MSDRRGQVSTVAAAAVGLALVLSAVLGVGVSLTGATTDLNLDGSGNQPADEAPDDRPEIGYAAVCIPADALLASDLLPEDIDVAFGDGQSAAEVTVTFDEDPLEFMIVVAGGGVMEGFDDPLGTNDEYTVTFGAGEAVDPQRADDDPCPLGHEGVKMHADGQREMVGGSGQRS